VSAVAPVASSLAGVLPAAEAAPPIGKVPFDRATATYSYVLVRQDLSLEQQLVQAVHAGMKAVNDHGQLCPDTRLAVLSVRDQAHLLACAGDLHDAGVGFSVFEEPDYAMGASALATAPGPELRLRCLKKLPLFRASGSAGVGVWP